MWKIETNTETKIYSYSVKYRSQRFELDERRTNILTSVLFRKQSRYSQSRSNSLSPNCQPLSLFPFQSINPHETILHRRTIIVPNHHSVHTNNEVIETSSITTARIEEIANFINHFSSHLGYFHRNFRVNHTVMARTREKERESRKRPLVPVNRVNGGFLYRIGLLKRIKARQALNRPLPFLPFFFSLFSLVFFSLSSSSLPFPPCGGKIVAIGETGLKGI